MKKFILFFLLVSSPVHSEEKPAFWWLEDELVDTPPVGDVKVYYNPKASKLVDKERHEDGIKIITVMHTKLDVKSNDWYEIEYDEGISVDPRFVIYKMGKEKKELGLFSGLTLVIPGNGSIYTSGHTNSPYNLRRKFTLKKGILNLTSDKTEEVKQPYKYVGLKTKTNEEIIIYSTKSQKNPVAKLVKGSEVEVLVNEDDYYLIATQFGLVGWYKLKHLYPVGVEHKSPIEGLYFAGD